jgi:hypothetical protein
MEALTDLCSLIHMQYRAHPTLVRGQPMVEAGPLFCRIFL